MKKVFLLMVASALLVLSGFAQTPAAGNNTGQASIKGCLGGSDGKYTVAEDGTSQILKITTSSVDLKLHLGQDVSLIGHKTSGTASSGADNSFAVTGLNVISEHCAATAVAPAAIAAPPVTTVSPSPGTTVIAPAAAAAASTPAASTLAAPASPPSATASTPAADAAVPAPTASPSSATASTPAVDTVVPDATVSPSSATASTPAVDAAVPGATVNPSSPTASVPTVDAAVPAVNATHAARPSAHPRAHSATPTATATAPAETVIPTAADTATAARGGPPSETAGTPVAAVAIPTATHKGGSLWLMILLVVLVIALTTLAPFLVRWRKRKMLERTDAPNLSLTHEVASDEANPNQDKPEPRKVA
jgi:hypothetical protein